MFNVTIIWTRAGELWPDDQVYFKGFDYLRLPCISFFDFDQATLLKQLQGFSFPQPDKLVGVLTSAHTIQSLHHSRYLFAKCKKWYAVGEKTKAYFERLGLPDCEIEWPSGVKKGADLGQFLCKTYAGNKNFGFFLPGASKRAYKLDDHLRSCGFEVLSCNTYEVKIGVFNLNGMLLSKSEFEQFFAKMKSPIICFASPSAVSGFTQALVDLRVTLQAKPIAVAIGPTTGKVCKSFFSHVIEAPEPSVASLLECAKSL